MPLRVAAWRTLLCPAYIAQRLPGHGTWPWRGLGQPLVRQLHQMLYHGPGNGVAAGRDAHMKVRPVVVDPGDRFPAIRLPELDVSASVGVHSAERVVSQLADLDFSSVFVFHAVVLPHRCSVDQGARSQSEPPLAWEDG